MEKNESYFQYYMEKYLGGRHMRLESGITDITNNKIHAELKKWISWKNGVGQLQIYCSEEYREELHLYLFGPSPKKKQVYIKLLLKSNIKPFEMSLNDKGFDIIDLINNKTIYTFIDKSIIKLLKTPIVIPIVKPIVKPVDKSIKDKDEHNCPRCGYKTNILCNFIKHLEKKNICKSNLVDISLDEIKLKYTEEKPITHVCEDCDTSFFSKSSYYAHKKVCDHKGVIKVLKKELQSLKASSSSTIINIQINELGKEDISYLKDNVNYMDFMVSCIEKETEGICDFLVQKHFNQKTPQNNNLKKLNKKDKLIDIYDGKKWKPGFTEDVLDDVFNYMEKDFQTFLNSGYDKQRLQKNIMDNFMKSIGGPLNWNLDHDEYSYEDENPSKEQYKKKIYLMACEYIYRKSKDSSLNV